MISIIIRCKNEDRYIGKVLSMIFEQIIDMKFEVLVFDSGSTDQTLNIARNFNVKIYQIPPETFTFGNSLNKAITLSNGEIICSLSAHCIPVTNYWLKELVEPVLLGKAHATIGRQIPIKALNPFEELAVSSYFPAVLQDNNKSPHLSNANCAFLKAIWHKNKFDENILGWEDYLWYLEMKSQYTFLYCPQAAVYHSHPFSLKYMVKRSYGDGKALIYIRKKLSVDLTGGKANSKTRMVKFIVTDLKNNTQFFLREKYYKYLLLLPIVKPLLYIAYLKGLRE